MEALPAESSDPQEALALEVLPDHFPEATVEPAEAPSAVPDTSISPLSHGEEPSNP